MHLGTSRFAAAGAAVLVTLLTSSLAQARPHGRRGGRNAPAAAAAATTACTPSWTTVDDFLPNGATKAAAGAVLALPFGSTAAAIVVGSTFTSNTSGNWVVREGVGNLWLTTDNHATSSGVAHPEAIARDASNGHVYVAGGENVPGSNVGPWIVRRSNNGFNQWSTVDTFDEPALPAAVGFAALVDANGHVLVGGPDAQSGDHAYHWVVRESSDDGNTWTTTDDDRPTRFTSGIYGLALNPTNNDVYAVGYDFDGSSYTWKVRKRAGGAWSNVDSYLRDPTHASSQGSVAFGVDVTAVGTVIVVGIGSDTNRINHWTIRRSTDDGASWSIVDDFGDGGGYAQCHPRSIAEDSGALLVTGECYDGTAYHWLTRASADDGVTWATEDEFQLATGEDSSAHAISAASAVAYAVGTGSTGGLQHWIVRRRVCQ